MGEIKRERAPDPGQPALRSHARQNRARILRVAAEAVERHGTEASLRGIARDAGVGMGTVYRHFPTRDDLLLALLQDGFEELVERARELVSANDPLAAMMEWLEQFCTKASSLNGLTAALVAKVGEPDSPLNASCKSMQESAASLLLRAQACERIRPDLTGDELLALGTSVAWFADHSRLDPKMRRRLLTLMLEGLERR